MPVRARNELSLNLLAAILATAPLAANSPANATTYSFTQIDVPGASLTIAWDINDLGQIVGNFNNSTLGQNGHGFLDTGGSFTQIDVPGAGQTLIHFGGAAVLN
jgi:hypothetical protein